MNENTLEYIQATIKPQDHDDLEDFMSLDLEDQFDQLINEPQGEE